MECICDSPSIRNNDGFIDQEVEKKPTIDLAGCVEIIGALVALGHSLSVRRRHIFVAMTQLVKCAPPLIPKYVYGII
jgi:hypothetical protein